MRQQIKLFSIFAFAMLAGTPRQAGEETPAKKSVNIVFIGDSITEGDGAAAPPVQASAYLLRQPAIDKLNFSNQGHSGYTTLNFLPAEASFKEAERVADSLQKLNTGILIFSIMLGTNDSAIDGPLGAPVSPGDYRKNIMNITDRLLNDFRGCKIILHHPTWYSPNTYNSSRYLAEGLKRLRSYIPELNAVIRFYQHAHPGQVFTGDTEAFDFFRKNYRDFLVPEKGQQGVFYLHPNREGAKMLGKFWGSAIYKAIEKF